jgi:hypothetical protein
MMVALSIGAFIIAGVLSSYTFLGRNLVRYSNQQQLEVQSRRALQMLTLDVHAATGVGSSFSNTLLPLSYSGGATVTYTYVPGNSSTGTLGTLTRTVTGTPPTGINNVTPITLLSTISTVSGFSFNCLDRQGNSVTSSGYAFRIKQIEVGNFTLITGTSSSGTQTAYTCASARLVLRNNHLVLQQNGQSY